MKRKTKRGECVCDLCAGKSVSPMPGCTCPSCVAEPIVMISPTAAVEPWGELEEAGLLKRRCIPSEPCRECGVGFEPVEAPRWDADPLVIKHGWTAGRCGNCGEKL